MEESIYHILINLHKSGIPINLGEMKKLKRGCVTRIENGQIVEEASMEAIQNFYTRMIAGIIGVKNGLTTTDLLRMITEMRSRQE